MSLASLPCFAWWFVAGALAGWLLWWLVDHLFLRNGRSAAHLNELEGQVGRARSELEMQKAAHAKLQSEFSNAQGRLADTSQQLSRYGDMEKTFEAEYRKVVTEREEIKQQLTVTASRLSSEHDSADAQLVAAHKEAETLQARLAAMQRDLELARTETATVTTRLQQEHKGAGTLQERIPALEGEITRLRSELTAAGARAEEAVSLNNRLRSEAGASADLRSALETHERTSKAAEAQIAQLKAALAERKGSGDEAVRLSAELASTRGDLDRMGKELHVAQEWLTRTGTELEQAREAHTSSLGEVQRLKAEIGTLNTQIGNYEKLRKALEAARQAADIGLDLHKNS